MPYTKMANSMEGQETVHSVVGPMEHSAAGLSIFVWSSSERVLTLLDLRLFLTLVFGEEPWKYDPKVIPLTWRHTEEDIIKSNLSGGLTLAYYSCDGVVCSQSICLMSYKLENHITDTSKVLHHPPIIRGVETVVSKLKQSGHTVLPWTPYGRSFGHDLINNIYAADDSTVSKSNHISDADSTERHQG
jgi:amidase